MPRWPRPWSATTCGGRASRPGAGYLSREPPLLFLPPPAVARPPQDIADDAGGDRGIQRFRATEAGIVTVRHGSRHGLRQAPALAADHDNGVAQRRQPMHVLAARSQPSTGTLAPARASPGPPMCGHPGEGAHAGVDRLLGTGRRNRAKAGPGQAEPVGDAQQRADIAGILHAVQGECQSAVERPRRQRAARHRPTARTREGVGKWLSAPFPPALTPGGCRPRPRGRVDPRRRNPPPGARPRPSRPRRRRAPGSSRCFFSRKARTAWDLGFRQHEPTLPCGQLECNESGIAPGAGDGNANAAVQGLVDALLNFGCFAGRRDDSAAHARTPAPRRF